MKTLPPLAHRLSLRAGSLISFSPPRAPRARSLTLALVLMGAVLTGGCGGGSTGVTPDGGPDGAVDKSGNGDTRPDVTPDTTPLTEARSFVVEGKLTLTPDGVIGSAARPTTQNFIVRLDPGAGMMILGGGGYATQAGMKTSDGVTFESTAPVSLPLAAPPCGGSTNYIHFSLTLTGAGVTGSGDGDADIIEGDVGYRYRAALTMTGVVDGAGPSLGADRTAVDPLGGLFLEASEPLPLTTTAQLVAGADTVPLMAYIPTGRGVVVGFNGSANALRYGTTYQVTATGGFQDLAGNAAAALPKIITQAPPVVAAEDGFEGAGTAIGGATVVDATTLPPIAGQRSVVLVSGFWAPQTLANSRRLTVRLALTAGDTVVRFSARPFSQFQGQPSNYQTAFRVAVPGGAIKAATLPPSEEQGQPITVPGMSSPLYFGAVRTIEIPLPAGASGEIVFDASAAVYSSACGLPPPPVSYLIDDLRVE